MQFWPSQYEGHGCTGESPTEGHKDDQKSRFSSEEGLRDLDLFSLEKRQFRAI